MDAKQPVAGQHTIASLIVLAVFLLLTGGLPLLGVLAGGLPLRRYLEFPPQTRYVDHAAFSWWLFVFLALLILGTVAPFVIHVLRQARTATAPPSPARAFPWWGCAGLGCGALFWLLSWTRFPWFQNFQAFTFTPLWLSYIIVINALSWRRTGRCLMCRRPCFFLLLFPTSAVFWWLFEYLNRFVQNWYYVGGGPYDAWEYFWRATLPFSTVLPAVLSTTGWLESFPRLTAGLEDFIRLPAVRSYPWAALLLLGFGAGLVGIGRWPNVLFPLLWTAPLAILAALLTLAGRPTLFDGVRQGDWRRVVRLALAALICGFFWEMWNSHSLAKWVYEIPYVGRFHLFEMPVLGYSGYLLFGLECGLIADLFGGDAPARPDVH
ncbi:MAG: hypothetical protein JXQ27_01830 [Acidobacteria bacterium]|nr:hypothetical protein [Acidobacteriota bacterium]